MSCYDSVILDKWSWQRHVTRVDQEVFLDRRLLLLSIVMVDR